MAAPASCSHPLPHAAARLLAPSLALLAASAAPAQRPQFGDDLVCAHLVPPGSHAVALADLDGDGDLDLAQARAEDLRPGAFVRFNDGQGSFSAEVELLVASAGPGGFAVAAGDLDGDGDVDLVFGFDHLRGAQNRVFVNDGAGRFTDETAARLPGLADRTRALALLDVDADQDLDLVFGNCGFPGEQDRLLLNDGAGRFRDVTATHLPALVEATTGIAYGDVDADGDLDLVLADGEWSPYARPALRLHLNDGTGHFTDATTTRLPAFGGEVPAAALRDLDGDGDLDLVAGCTGSEYPALSQNLVYVNDGRGTFTDESALRLPAPRDDTVALAVADLDGDGDPDLVFGNQPFQNARDLDGRDTLYLNDGTGHFVDASDRLPALFDRRRDFAVGDVDGDGRLDLIAANFGQDQLLLNRGGGHFAAASGPTVGLPGIATSIDSGDIDGDGDLDLAVGVDWGRASTLLRNDGVGGLHPVPGVDLSDGRPAFGDVDGDGHLDVVLATEGQNRLYLQDPATGSWADVTASHFPADVRPTRRIQPVDLDGDGDLDLVLANGGAACCPERDQLYRNDGGGRFAIASTSEFPARVERTRDLDVGDVDGDGDVDLVTAGYDRTLRLFANDGTGRFAERSGALPVSGWTVRLVDADDDGALDLVSGEPGTLALARNDGRGGFVDISATHLPAGSPQVTLVIAGDVDDDGDADLVIQDAWSPQLYLNDGGGRFVAAAGRITASARFPTYGSTLLPMRLVDLDGDGDPELLRGDAAFGRPSSLAVHPNRHRHVGHPRLARTGLRWDFEVWARPGYGRVFEVAVPLVGRRRGHLPLPPFGTLQLDAATMVGLDPLYVPPGVGHAVRSMVVPNDSGLVGCEVFTQAVLVSPIDVGRLSNAVRVRIVR